MILLAAAPIIALGALLLLPILVLFTQVVVAALRGTPQLETHGGARPPLAILIPAHNEAANIESTLANLRPQLRDGDRLLVIADNCSDATAAVAAAAGAEVTERENLTQRGKGYALAHGVAQLAANPPAIVVIIDADCTVSPGALDLLAARCAASGRPTQALYLMRNAPGASLKMRIAEFAWVTKNLARPLGYHVLGLPCQLMGTGMAFSWDALSRAELATGHIVEDLKLGIDLATAGTPPLFCPEALVLSYFPDSQEGAKTQRTRWEHGHLGVILRDAPKLLAKAIGRADGTLLALALDLAVPPLALLTLVVVALLGVSTGFYLGTGFALPLQLSGLGFTLFFVAITLSWARFARSIVSAFDLAYAGVYAFLKIPIYLKFLTNKQVEWVRSARKGE